MKNRNIAAALLLALVFTNLGWWWLRVRPSRAPSNTVTPELRELPDFILLDQNGNAQRLSREAERPAVLLIAHAFDDSVTRDALPRVRALAERFAAHARVWWLNTEALNRTELERRARAEAITQPILMDTSRIVTHALRLERAGTAILLNPRTREVYYRGELSSELEQILQSFQNGRTPPARRAAPPQKNVRGISYRQHIAPLLARKCVACHLGPYPVSLNSYAALKANAPAIRRALYLDQMPPFSADPALGPYHFDNTLKPEQKRRLVLWLEAGLPNDGGGDELLDPSARLTERPPRPIKDPLIYTARPATPVPVPANGEAEYKYAQLGGPAPRDLWITGVNLKTTRPEVMMMASLYVVPSSLDAYTDKALAAQSHHPCFDSSLYLIGAMANDFKKDQTEITRHGIWMLGRPQPIHIGASDASHAIFVRKGSYLILETFRRGNLNAFEDNVEVDFFGRNDAAGLRAIQVYQLKAPTISIPAENLGHREHTIRWRPQRAIALTQVTIHMHLRGRAFKLLERHHDGHTTVLASIPNFVAGLAGNMSVTPIKPIEVSQHSTLIGECEYDNSSLTSPLPSDQPVHFGMTKDGSEMCNLSLHFFNVN